MNIVKKNCKNYSLLNDSAIYHPNLVSLVPWNDGKLLAFLWSSFFSSTSVL